MAVPTTSTVARPQAFGYTARLDTLLLRAAVAPDRPLDIVTAPLEAQKINTAQSAEDIRNEFGAIFSRSSFVGGEGLDFAHQADASPDRYWDSEHIDISNPAPGEPAKITLLPPTANIETSTDTNLHLAWDGTRLVMGEGTSTRRSSDPTASSPTFAASDPHGGEGAQTINDLTSLGNIVYAAIATNGLHAMTAGTWSSLNNTDTKKAWGVKLLLLVSTGTVLAEANVGTGAYTTRVTLPAGQEWLDCADCGRAILACASDGNVYALANDSSGTLTLQAQTPMPQNGEVPYAVGFDGTFVFIATRQATPSGAIGRFYRAMLGDNYELTDAQLLRQWGDQSATVDHAPRRIVRDRKGVVFGVYETAGSYLWRYDSASGGLSRYLDLGASGLVVDILVISGRLFATVSGHGMRREKVGSYETDGYLIGPLGDLFTASPKSWAGALIDHETIADNERIELYYTTDPSALSDSSSSSWVRIKNITDSQDDNETALSNVDGRFLAGMVKLYADSDATVTPSVRSFAFRAYPGPGDVEINLAVNTSDWYERPGHRRVLVKGLGQEIYDELKNKEGRYAELHLYVVGETLRGVVKQVATRIPQQPLRGSPSAVTMLTFRGRRVSEAGTSTTEGAMGIGQMGLTEMGVTS